LIFLKRINTKNKKVFFLYTTIVAILIGFVIITRYVNDSPEQYYLVTRIYNILEYFLLAYFFSLHITNKFVRKFLLISTFPFFIFCIYDFVSAKEPTLAFYPLTFEYLVLLLFIVYFFFEVMQETVVEPIYQKAIFWISVAFIINFSGNFFLFLYSKNSYNDEAFKRQFTIIYCSVTILKNILLCIAVSIKEKNNELRSFDNISLDSKLDNYLPFKNQH
jgi:hypothetical protein